MNTSKNNTVNSACKNCNQSFTGEYCSSCGQKRADRITLKGLIHEALSTVLNLDKGFLHTVIELTIRPAQTFRDFLAGKRRPFTPPFQYLFVSVTVFLILFHLSDQNSEIKLTANLAEGAKEGIEQSDHEAKNTADFKQLQSKLNQFIRDLVQSTSEYANLLLILVVPCYSWAAYGLLRQLRLRFAEHLVLNCYIFAHQTLCGLFLVIPINFFPDTADWLPARQGLIIFYLTLTVGYQIWAYTTLFPSPTVDAGLRTTGAVLIAWLIYFAVLELLVAIAFLFFFLFIAKV